MKKGQNKIDNHSQLATVTPEAWRQAYKLPGLAGEDADRMRCRAAETMDVAEDFEARCAKAKGVVRRTAHIVEYDEILVFLLFAEYDGIV